MLFNKQTILGLTFIFFIALLSYFVSLLPFIAKFNISPLIIGILIGTLWTNLTNNLLIDDFKEAIYISSKYLLRLGIILYGFKVSLTALSSVGILGILISIIVVSSILVIGYYIGVKFLKLDAQTALLISAGSAICGAAAVLALDGVLKATKYKVSVAISTVVVFGTIAMFLYPALYDTGLTYLNNTQEGFYIGGTVHEVAHVVAASGAINTNVQEIAVIVKMLRVILLVPVLIILSIIKPKLIASVEGENLKNKIIIPWFALMFLLCIIFNSYIHLPSQLINNIKLLDNFLLCMAMISLGLNTHLKSFKNTGGKSFALALILFIFLVISGWLLVKFLI